MTDDAATVREALEYRGDYMPDSTARDAGMEALDRLAARAARADELEISLRAWEDIVDDETARADRYEEAIRWALGERDAWLRKSSSDGAFYWRRELRRRAALDAETADA